jgi:hypothetical protein
MEDQVENIQTLLERTDLIAVYIPTPYSNSIALTIGIIAKENPLFKYR